MKASTALAHLTVVGLFVQLSLVPLPATAQSAQGLSARAAAVINHWTPERKRQAIPRDLLIDERGLGYLRQRDGYLQPYGHDREAVLPQRQTVPSPFGKPTGGNEDTTPPVISSLDPAEGQVIGASHVFRATVKDASGISRVDFKIGVQSFSAAPSKTDPDVWEVSLQGFTDGTWSYQVVAKDGAGKGGNTATSEVINFSVSTGSTGGGGGGSGGDTTISEAPWDPNKTRTDAVTKASGRIYFEMPTISRHRKWGETITWNGYVCSGTVANDGQTTDRSIIITAAHCVYDDVSKMFARNVLFIPNQNATTGSGTDSNCGNDPMGCWAPSFGAVDDGWKTRTFPANIPWDYAFYVVDDLGAHSGTAVSSDKLDVVAGSLSVQFTSPFNGVFTHALGYSYSQDPSLRYCAENLGVESGYNDWWLGSCGLSGGASGGPWIQPLNLDSGEGPIISVNSWGYTNQPGMGGPPLHNNSAACLFEDAKSKSLGLGGAADGQQGFVRSASTCP